MMRSGFPVPLSHRPIWFRARLIICWRLASSYELTEEQLARAIRIDPGQIAGFGPSIDALIAMLLERKRKILEKYETGRCLSRCG